MTVISHLGVGERQGVKYCRPCVEGLEDRLVLAAPGSLALPLAIQDIRVVGTQLEAVVSLAGQAVNTVLIDLGTHGGGQGECPILHVALGPIHLNLLGLHVDTSQICLDVSAVDHQGLLGGLLCDLTSGLNLGGVLSGLGTQLNNFLDRLDNLLDDVLSRPFNVTDVLGGGAGHQQGGTCDILNLSLGPVDLDVPLLGVSVELDDCHGGPVTVDITADPNGGLLGQVLCSLADGLDHGGVDRNGLITRLQNVLDRLFDLARRLDQFDDLSGPLSNLIHQADNLVNQLVKAANHVDDLKDLDQFINRLDHTIDRLDTLLDRLI